MGFDPRAENPFPPYDAEIRRLRVYLRSLDAAGWRAPSHADDIGVPIAARARSARWRWRSLFGIWAAREEGEPENARLENGTVRLRVSGQVHHLEPETFVAYLTNRPQQLTDPQARALVKRLGRSG